MESRCIADATDATDATDVNGAVGGAVGGAAGGAAAGAAGELRTTDPQKAAIMGRVDAACRIIKISMDKLLHEQHAPPGPTAPRSTNAPPYHHNHNHTRDLVEARRKNADLIKQLHVAQTKAQTLSVMYSNAEKNYQVLAAALSAPEESSATASSVADRAQSLRVRRHIPCIPKRDPTHPGRPGFPHAYIHQHTGERSSERTLRTLAPGQTPVVYARSPVELSGTFLDQNGCALTLQEAFPKGLGCRILIKDDRGNLFDRNSFPHRFLPGTIRQQSNSNNKRGRQEYEECLAHPELPTNVLQRFLVWNTTENEGLSMPEDDKRDDHFLIKPSGEKEWRIRFKIPHLSREYDSALWSFVIAPADETLCRFENLSWQTPWFRVTLDRKKTDFTAWSSGVVE